jgi:dihydroorotate dehydrogenase electron transfer subunit
VIENRPLSGGSHLLRIAHSDARAAAPRSQPGQFVQMLASPSQHLLRRPMSILDEGDGWRAFMVKPVGPASRELTSLQAGDAVDTSPPLGRGFPAAAQLAGWQRETRTPLLLVGGGFGIAPLRFVARRLDVLEPAVEYRILYGGRTAPDVEREVLDGVRGEIIPTTDDGTLGFHGTCVARAALELERAPAGAVVLACGSHAMMRALYDALAGRGARLFVSLEEVMGCGVGVCMGCVTPSVEGYVPICTHGPVFEATRVFGPDVIPNAI